MHQPYMSFRFRTVQEPVLWFGHFAMQVDPHDARFFLVCAVPNPVESLMVVHNLQAMTDIFGFDLDASSQPHANDASGAAVERLNYAAIDLACSMRDTNGYPIVVLGLGADDPIFNLSYVGFIKAASERLGKLLASSQYFGRNYIDWMLAHNEALSKIEDKSPDDTEWSGKALELSKASARELQYRVVEVEPEAKDGSED